MTPFRLSILLTIPLASAATILPVSIREPLAIRHLSEQEFVMGPSTANLPVGVFLLIKKKQSLGALRFTKIEHGDQIGIGSAEYESYFQRVGPWQAQSAQRATGEVILKPITGIPGIIAFQPGQTKVRVGEWTFGSGYPGSIDMWPLGEEEGDYAFEFAPTSARNPLEIDFLDKKLRWFRFDPNASVTLPASSLPK